MQICKCGSTSQEKKFYSSENICQDCYFIRKEKNKFKKIDDPEKIGQKIIELYRTYNKTTEVIAKCVQVSEQEIIDFLIQYGFYDLSGKRCGKCGDILHLSDFSKGQLNPAGWCKKCIVMYNDAYYTLNTDEIKERTSKYYYDNYEDMKILRNDYQRFYNQMNKDLKRNSAAIRRAAKLKATVSWSNKQNIIKIYKEAVRLTKETGILHVVDHIDPLQSKLICGLHIETNLQILTVSENATKSNKFVPYILDSEANKILV